MPNPADIRHAVLHYLAPRARIAQSAPVIAARLRPMQGCSDDDVRDALKYLQGMSPPMVHTIEDPLDRGTLYWQITTAGAQHVESGGAE